VGKAKRAHHSLPERTGNIPEITAPVGREKAAFDEAMKAAVGPVDDT
jgi:hypothetical protein